MSSQGTALITLSKAQCLAPTGPVRNSTPFLGCLPGWGTYSYKNKNTIVGQKAGLQETKKRSLGLGQNFFKYRNVSWENCGFKERREEGKEAKEAQRLLSELIILTGAGCYYC